MYSLVSTRIVSISEALIRRALIIGALIISSSILGGASIIGRASILAIKYSKSLSLLVYGRRYSSYSYSLSSFR